MPSSEVEAEELTARLTPPSWPRERDAVLAATQARLFGEQAPPRRLGRYLLLERAGSGGMGVVWAAYDPELDRRVALKLVVASAATRDREAERTRLLREAQAAAKLAHPNVVTVHDIGTYEPADHGDELGVFVVMELIPGRTLAAWMAEERRSWREVVDLFVEAGRGLAAAHAVGLVHRDFKPHNVMIGDDGRARVLDFGLARLDARAGNSDVDAGVDGELTRRDTVVGTPLYMAPEQHACAKVDARADQFAFCVALFEALHGKRAFTGTLDELARSKLAGAVAEPSHKLPSRLERALRRGLAPHARDRFGSMDALLAELTRTTRAGRRFTMLALVAAGVVGLAIYASRTNAVACEGATAALSEVWNEGTRTAIERAFVATDHPEARVRAAAATQSLDDYASAWTEARMETCRSSAAADDETRAVLARRGDCLDARLRALEEATTFLAHADRAIVSRASRVVGVLPPLPSCTDDIRTISAGIGSVEEQGTVERMFTRLRALRLVDRFDEAAATGEEIVALAEQLHHRPTEARGLIALAWAHEGARRFDRAEPALRRAWAIAEGDGLHTESMRAMIDLAGVMVEQGRCREALDLLPIVDAKATYAGSRSEGTRSDIDFVRGRALACAGDLDEAREVLDATLRVRQRVFGPDHVGVAWVADALAGVEERAGALDRAAPLREEARRIRRVAGVCIDERCDAPQ